MYVDYRTGRPKSTLALSPGLGHYGCMTAPRKIAPGEYYHIFTRGTRRQILHHDNADYVRMIYYILHMQSIAPLGKSKINVSTFDPKLGFIINESLFERIIQTRAVEVVAFSIMPNHTHLLVRELVEGSIARYMQRIGTAYTKYFQKKYGVEGHIFQGRYGARHVTDNTYLTHLSAYIHKNPSELNAWNKNYFEYPWSSLQDYTKENRWGGLLAPEVILDQFDGTKKSNYADFVKSSTAKE